MAAGGVDKQEGQSINIDTKKVKKPISFFRQDSYAQQSIQQQLPKIKCELCNAIITNADICPYCSYKKQS